MSRGAKSGLVLLAGTLLIALGLIASAPLLIERVGLAQTIETAVRDATGLTLGIDGEPRLRWWPRPVVELGPLTLSAADDGQMPLARAARLRVRIAALPLLLGRVELRQATCEGLRLSTRIIAPEGRAADWWWPAVDRLKVQDARIALRYRDGDGPTWLLFAPDAGLSAAGTGGRIDAAFVLDTKRPTLHGALRLTATIEPSPEPSPAPSPDPSPDPARSPIRNATPTPTPRAAPIRITDLRLRGSDLSIGEGRGLALALDAALIERDPGAGTWHIPALTLTSDALRVDGELQVRRSATGAVISGGFTIPGFDPRAWMQAHGYGPGRGMPSTLRCGAARGRFALDRDGLLLKATDLRLDDTHAAGSAWLPSGPARAELVALAVDRLDLDPYFADAVSGEAKPAVADQAGPGCRLAAAEGLAEPAAGPMTAPALPASDRDADLIAHLEVGSLRFGGLGYDNLTVAAQAQGGLGRADIEAANFYAGTLTARAERDDRGGVAPRHTLRAAASGFDVASLLADLQGSAPITGTGDLRAELAASGSDAEALKADLSGTVFVEVRDGRFATLDLGPLMTAAGGKAEDAATATAFTSLSGTAIGSKGRFLSRDIAGSSPLLRVAGQGRFDVPAETLDLDLTASFVDGPNGRGTRGLAGLRVPITVAGPWQRPAWRPDLGPALREGARRMLDHSRETLKEIEQRTGIEGLEQQLRGLFGF